MYFKCLAVTYLWRTQRVGEDLYPLDDALLQEIGRKVLHHHPVKLHRLLPEAIEQIVGILGNPEVLQPLLWRQEEPLVAILEETMIRVEKEILWATYIRDSLYGNQM